MLNSRLLGTGLVLASIVIAATAPAQQATETLKLERLTGTRGGRIVTSVNSDPRTFNRIVAHDYTGSVVSDLISGDLVHLDRSTLQLEPSLASRWEASTDRRTLTLHLRRGIRFSDGSPLTADDVLFSLQVAADPKTASPLSDLLAVDGVPPQFARLDAQTIRITFARPVGLGIRNLDSLPIVPKQRLERAYRDGKFASAWSPSTAPSEIAGAGPFRLKEYQPGVRVVLERNPHYWKQDRAGQTLPYLDTITILIIPDPAAEALRFQSGETDLLNAIDADSYAALRRAQPQGNFTLQDLGPGLEFDFLWFNLNPGRSAAGKPFVDPEKLAIFEKSEFRRAVSHAINRPAIARSILLGLGAPQFGPVGPGNKLWHNPRVPQTEYNQAKARQMLGAIGLRDSNGDGFLELRPGRPLEISLLTSRGITRRERTAEILREDLAKVGLKLLTQPVDQRDLIQRIVSSFDYESILFGFTPTDLEPDILADLWTSGGSNHFWHPNQPKPARPWEAELDALTSRLLRSFDPAERKTIFDQMQEILAREMPLIPTVSRHILTAWRNKIRNIRPSIRRPHLLWNAEELFVAARSAR